MYWAEEDEKARIRIPKLKELLHEILGYNDEEIRIMEERYFSNYIAKNLTGEQVLKIAQPFHDWNITPSLRDNTTNELIGYNPAQLYLQSPSPLRYKRANFHNDILSYPPSSVTISRFKESKIPFKIGEITAARASTSD